jgi:hypothetical protein
MLFINKLKKASNFPTSVPWKHSGAFPPRNYCAIDKKLIESPRAEWSTDDVCNWASHLDNVIEEDLEVFRKQRINGEALLRISQEDLERLGMKYGPASKIIAAMKQPDTSQEYWHQLLKAIDTITPMKVEWNGDPAEDPNLLVLSLPKDLEWPTLKSPHLFVRTRYNCYDKIWKAIEGAYLRHQGPFERALIQGNSGIGKTAFLNFALYRARKQGYPVLFETKELRVFIQGDKVECEEIQQIGALSRFHQNPNVLVLHDHKPQSEPPILSKGAFVIAPVSPDARNSKEFRKDWCLKRWMPLPTIQELKAMNSIDPQLSSKILAERLDIFGPITRQCLTQTSEDYLSKKVELEPKLRAFRYQDLAPMLRAATPPTTQEYGLSWWIIHVDATENLDKPKVDWGTPWIRDQIATFTGEREFTELEDFLAKTYSIPSPEETRPTKEYEVWVAIMLARGMELPFRYYSEVGELVESRFSFPKSDVVQTDELFNINELKEASPKIFRSRRKEPVLCDIAVVAEDTLVLLQATTGMDHEINLKRLKEYANEAVNLKLQHILLIYIVPEQKCFKFQPAQLTPALDYVKNEPRVDIKIAISEMKPRRLVQIKSSPTNE